jgi:hypothetical protein
MVYSEFVGCADRTTIKQKKQSYTSVSSRSREDDQKIRHKKREKCGWSNRPPDRA